MNRELMHQELIADEGIRTSAYQDSLGYWTIGVGHLIDARKGGGLSDRVINLILDDDIDSKCADLDHALPWWRTTPETVQRALLNMCFQLSIGNGTTGLTSFKTSLARIQAGQYQLAGKSLRDSLWYKQTPHRAERVIEMIERS